MFFLRNILYIYLLDIVIIINLLEESNADLL